jgi:hypothetical protein
VGGIGRSEGIVDGYALLIHGERYAIAQTSTVWFVKSDVIRGEIPPQQHRVKGSSPITIPHPTGIVCGLTERLINRTEVL